MPRKVGRPRKPAKERLTELVRFRVRKVDRDAMERAAAAADKELEEWAREKLIEASAGY